MNKPASLHVVLLLSCAVAGITPVYADSYRAIYDGKLPTNRAGATEISLQLRYHGEETLGFDGGAGVKIEDDTGWGFSLGYNFDNHWNLNWEFSMVEPDYRATFVDANDASNVVSFDHELSMSSTHFNLTYHFFESAVTPFVSAGLGWTYTDSNVLDGPGFTTCWYTWYGLVCNSGYDTYDDTSFSYQAAVGLRWDINGAFFVRGSAGYLWLDYDDTQSKPTFELGRLELGFKM